MPAPSVRPPRYQGIQGRTGKPISPPPLEAILGALQARPPPPIAAAPTTKGDARREGWAVLFAPDTAAEVRQALSPLVKHRGGREIDLRVGETNLQGLLGRFGLTPGTLDREKLPGFLLLVGPPDVLPFELQYLLGVDYHVGRLAFDDASEYSAYVESLLRWERGEASRPERSVLFWGPEHAGDPSTRLSTRALFGPLLAGGKAARVTDLHGYRARELLGELAGKQALLARLTGDPRPAIVLTGSHGFEWAPDDVRRRDERQRALQGALITQDWPAAAPPDEERHLLSARSVPDESDLSGLVALLFACFSAGTPARSDVGSMLLGEQGPPLSAAPFVAALPNRLLSRPRGAALAVLGHVDFALGFSLESEGTGAVGTFREALGRLMAGEPAGAAARVWSARFAALSAQLLTEARSLAPRDALGEAALADRWAEWCDARAFVLLGDPAARLDPAQWADRAHGRPWTSGGAAALDLPPPPPEEEPRARLLFLAANPDTGQPLRPDLELGDLQRAAAQVVDIAPHLNLDAGQLLDRLTSPASIVYMTSHGRGGSMRVHGGRVAQEDIVDRLCPDPGLSAPRRWAPRLVILSLCQSDGLAAALCARPWGPPYAVGMRGDVPESAIFELSARILRGLAAGETVEAAFGGASAVYRSTLEIAPGDAAAPQPVLAVREGVSGALFVRREGLVPRVDLGAALHALGQRGGPPALVHFHALFSPASEEQKGTLVKLARRLAGDARFLQVDLSAANERALLDAGVTRFPTLWLGGPEIERWQEPTGMEALETAVLAALRARRGGAR